MLAFLIEKSSVFGVFQPFLALFIKSYFIVNVFLSGLWSFLEDFWSYLISKCGISSSILCFELSKNSISHWRGKSLSNFERFLTVTFLIYVFVLWVTPTLNSHLEVNHFYFQKCLDQKENQRKTSSWPKWINRDLLGKVQALHTQVLNIIWLKISQEDLNEDVIEEEYCLACEVGACKVWLLRELDAHTVRSPHLRSSFLLLVAHLKLK